MSGAPVIPSAPPSGDLLPRPMLRGEVRVAGPGAVDVACFCSCGHKLAELRADHAPDEVLTDPELEARLLARVRAELPPLGFVCPACEYGWHTLYTEN